MEFVYDRDNEVLHLHEDDEHKEVFSVGDVVTLAYCSDDYDEWPTIRGTIEGMSDSRLSVLTLDERATHHVFDYSIIIAIKKPWT